MGRLLIECALNFYNDFVEPTKQPFVPNDAERGQLREVAQWLRDHDGAEAEEIEKAIYDFGRRFYDKPGRIFTPLYRAILSQERGPRLGAFIRLATPSRIVDLLEAAIARRAA